jgi:O-antigen/teichoic acid export membrane protein
MKIVEVLMVLGWFYLNSMLPALSAAFEKHETQRLSSLFWASLKILWSLGIFICLMWYIFKTEIISLIATQDYIMPTQGIYSSVDVLWVVFFVLFFHFLALCCIYILIASEKQSLLLKINIAISVLNIIGNIIFIPYFSFYGAAIVTLCSQILLFIVTFFIIWKIVKIPWKYIIQLWKSLFLAGIIYLCFSEYFVYTSYSPLQKIFIFGPTIFIIYWGIELLFSYKLFSKA